MYKLFQTIKQSRAIVVLFIIYSVITIGVVALDRSLSDDKDKNKTETKDNVDTALESFISEVSDLYEQIDDYVVRNNILESKCIPLSEIVSPETEGSVYLSENAQKYFVWYSNGEYAINALQVTDKKIDSSDVDEEYNTLYYNQCGMSE